MTPSRAEEISKEVWEALRGRDYSKQRGFDTVVAIIAEAITSAVDEAVKDIDKYAKRQYEGYEEKIKEAIAQEREACLKILRDNYETCYEVMEAYKTIQERK